MTNSKVAWHPEASPGRRCHGGRTRTGAMAHLAKLIARKNLAALQGGHQSLQRPVVARQPVVCLRLGCLKQISRTSQSLSFALTYILNSFCIPAILDNYAIFCSG